MARGGQGTMERGGQGTMRRAHFRGQDRLQKPRLHPRVGGGGLAVESIGGHPPRALQGRHEAGARPPAHTDARGSPRASRRFSDPDGVGRGSAEGGEEDLEQGKGCGERADGQEGVVEVEQESRLHACARHGTRREL